MVLQDQKTGLVDRTDLVKGYEVAKNRYVVLTDSEITDVRLPSSGTIDIEQFVDADSIDRIYWNDPYYVAPDGKSGIEAYGVIRHAMVDAGKIALGRVVLHTRERLVAIEPRGVGLLLTTLRSHDEIRADDEAFTGLKATKPDRRMLEIASKILAQQEAQFDPSRFEDRYENALRALIKRKSKGQKVVVAPPPEEEKVVDLMDALAHSLRKGGAPRERAKRFLSSAGPKPVKRRARG